jgi:hypothetical protein
MVLECPERVDAHIVSASLIPLAIAAMLLGLQVLAIILAITSIYIVLAVELNCIIRILNEVRRGVEELRNRMCKQQ